MEEKEGERKYGVGGREKGRTFESYRLLRGMIPWMKRG